MANLLRQGHEPILPRSRALPKHRLADAALPLIAPINASPEIFKAYPLEC